MVDHVHTILQDNLPDHIIQHTEAKVRKNPVKLQNLFQN